MSLRPDRHGRETGFFRVRLLVVALAAIALAAAAHGQGTPAGPNLPTPAAIQGDGGPGIPDVALFALPPGNGWPTQLVVKNLGNKISESTIVRAKVVLTQGNLDVVAQNCHPRFVDFDEAVPALEFGGSATILLFTKIGPGAVAAWNALNKPVRAGARPANVKTPTPGNPVQTVVVCRYTLTAALGPNQNLDDPNKANNKLARDIVESVPLK